MHELSIALSIVEVACEELERRGAVRAAAVHVRVGALSVVVADALHFCFDAATLGTALEGARLVIEDVPVRARCHACGDEHTLQNVARRRCPVCHGLLKEVISGEELEVVAMELIDP